VLVATAAVRLAIAAYAPLFPDEAYYWEWSRRLAAGYYDHPPLVAYLIWLGTIAFGDSPIGIRFAPVLAGIAGTWFVAATARRLVDERAALLAALIFAAMPLSAAGLVLATPDPGLLAGVAATVYCVVRAMSSTRSGATWWVAAGVAQGLSFYAKYTAILVPMGLAIALMARTELRHHLRTTGPYVATLVASLVFLPVLTWNANHDWISFTFQIQHGLGRSGGAVLQRELELLGGQLAIVSPILFVMMMLAVGRAVVTRPPSVASNPASSYLSVIALFVLAFFAYSATKRRAEANWPAIAYIPAVLVLLARARSLRWDRWLNAGVVVAAVMTLVTYVDVFTPIFPVPPARDPASRAHGWRGLAQAVQVEGVTGAASPAAPHTFIAANRYQEAAVLAFHMTSRPRTFSLNVGSRANQYDLWPTFAQTAVPGDTLLVLLDAVEGTHPAVASLAPHFAAVRVGADIARTRGVDTVGLFRVWEMAGWRGTWLPTPIRSAR